MKTCPKCDVNKEDSDYYKNSSTKDGLQSYCKVCCKQATRHHRSKKGGKAQVPNNGFSTDRYCTQCKTTKDWKKYHAEIGMCADCWRGMLSDAATSPSQPHHSTKKKVDHMADLLNFLDRQVADSNEVADEAVN